MPELSTSLAGSGLPIPRDPARFRRYRAISSFVPTLAIVLTCVTLFLAVIYFQEADQFRRATVAQTVEAREPETKFQPYVPAEELRPELTARAVLLGGFFGLLFGAVTVYVGLRAGLTVAASIPIAVLSISILRALGKASILENNIVQTTGSAGESVAG